MAKIERKELQLSYGACAYYSPSVLTLRYNAEPRVINLSKGLQGSAMSQAN